MPEPFWPKMGFGMKVACRPMSSDLAPPRSGRRTACPAVSTACAVLEVDLVLAGRDLVVRGLDLESHGLEREYDLAPTLLTEIRRRQVEVPGRVVRLGRRLARCGALKQKELGLGTDHQLVAERGGLLATAP